MKFISNKSTTISCLIGLYCLSSLPSLASASPVQCTKSKNGGDILLYGNSDWIGGWTEVYADTSRRSLRGDSDGGRDLQVTAGASFDLMFEMDCDACIAGPSCRTFDFDLMSSLTGDAVTEHSFAGQAIEYQHYLSSAIDHSIFRMDTIGPIPAGEYTYCVTSYVDGANGSEMEASMCGTLSSLVDVDSPAFSSAISISPDTATVAPGTSVTLTMQVQDDTVLNYLNVNVKGEYYQRIGLKTQGNKVSPNLNNPRSVSVTYEIPSKGKVEPCDFNFRLCDLMNKCVEEDVTVNVVKPSGGGGGGGGKPPKP